MDLLGQAVVDEIRQVTVPVATGELRSSVQWEPVSGTHGNLVMRKYGVYVEHGHRVGRRKGAAYTQDKHGTRAAKSVPPNPFIARALASPRVQAAKRAYLRAMLGAA